jgi:CubicO group peptidase (beta-lactamase class C family)
MTTQTAPTPTATFRAGDRQPLGPELSSLSLDAQAGSCARAQLESLLRRGEEVGLAYAVVGGAGTVFEYAGGVADVATGTPVSSRMMFSSASNTKVLTAAAVIQLATRGLLRLDDPLARYVPEQPYTPHVTLRQLLDHSSGVPNPMPLAWVHTEQEHADYAEAAGLRAELCKHPKLRFEPGARYLYSNLGYWLLGRVIEEVSQTDYVSYLRSNILLPLGVTEEQLSFDMASAECLARGHLHRRSMLGVLVPWLVPSKLVASRHGRWLRFEHIYMNGAAYGGAFATAAGYARVMQDWLQPSPLLLGEVGKRWFFEPQHATSGRALQTTLGWHIGALDTEPYFSKPGGGPGFSSNLRIYPRRQLATVLLSNRMRASEAAIQRFTDVVDRALLRDG